MSGQKEVILYDSPEAAQFKSGLSGWVSADGHFFGNDEHIARWSGCTHKRCECGSLHEKYWTVCQDCRDKRSAERYAAMPAKEGAGEPLVDFGSDHYFWDEAEVQDYIDEVGPDGHQLVICEPVIAPYIEEYAIDELPEDMAIDDVDPELADLIEKVNVYIQEKKPILSWVQGKFRATIRTSEPSNDS